MEIGSVLERIADNNRIIIEKNMEELYSKFGFDISKATRKLTDLTDKEAEKLGEIFNERLSPWIVRRGISKDYYPFEGDREGIKLFSFTGGISIDKIESSKFQDWISRYLLLFSNGNFYKRGIPYNGDYDKVGEYLCSLGIRTFDFPEERFKKSRESTKLI
ncbi:MAG: hypothetical protein AABW47_03870 [Nanoarchaeota archaeon]